MVLAGGRIEAGVSRIHLDEVRISGLLVIEQTILATSGGLVAHSSTFILGCSGGGVSLNTGTGGYTEPSSIVLSIDGSSSVDAAGEGRPPVAVGKKVIVMLTWNRLAESQSNREQRIEKSKGRAGNDEPRQLELVRGIRENQKKDASRRKEGSRRELALMLSDAAEGSLASPERQRQQVERQVRQETSRQPMNGQLQQTRNGP